MLSAQYIIQSLYSANSRGNGDKNVGTWKKNPDALAMMLNELENTFIKYNVRINKGKTKILIASRRGTQSALALSGERLENVASFTYLRRNISSDGKSKVDSVSRMNQTKADFNNNKKLLTNNNINLFPRKQLLKHWSEHNSLWE